jgi:hypothetical protein
MEMKLVIVWIALSIIFASFGSKRGIEFKRAFLVCLILSPLIGLILILISVSGKRSDTLMKQKIIHYTRGLTDEEHNKAVRKIVPSKEENKKEIIGYVVFAIIVIAAMFIYKSFG